MTISEYYKWLKKEWAKVCVILSIFLFVILFAIVRQFDFVIFILLLQTPLYMLHQTEEYIFPGGVLKGELEGLSLFSQYDPHGVFLLWKTSAT